MYKRLALLGLALAAVLAMSGCAVYPGYGYGYYDGYSGPDDYYYDDYYYSGNFYWYLPGYYWYYPDYWYDHGRRRPPHRPPGRHDGDSWHGGNRFQDQPNRPPRGDIGTARPSRPPGQFTPDSRQPPPKGLGGRIRKPENDDDQEWGTGFRAVPDRNGSR